LLSDAKRETLRARGLRNPRERGGIAFPSVFVLDTGGEIVYRSLDRTVSRTGVCSILNFLRSYQQDETQTLDNGAPFHRHSDLLGCGCWATSEFLWPALTAVASDRRTDFLRLIERRYRACCPQDRCRADWTDQIKSFGVKCSLGLSFLGLCRSAVLNRGSCFLNRISAVVDRQ
jgi:hypothetical protein